MLKGKGSKSKIQKHLDRQQALHRHLGAIVRSHKNSTSEFLIQNPRTPKELMKIYG